MVVYGQHAQRETPKDATTAGNYGIDSELQAQNGDRSTEKSSGRVHVRAKHFRNLADQQIAHRAPANTCDTAHHGSQQRMQLKLQRLGRTSDRKEAEPGRIQRSD